MNRHPESFLQEIIFYFRYEAKDEFAALFRWLRYYILLWIMIAVALALAISYLNFGPNKKAILGYAQVGSSYRVLAEHYQEFFQENGLQLQLSEVSHIGESADQLQRDSAPLNASFVLAGTTLNAAGEKKYASLGSVKYAPGWLFFRGPEIQGSSPFNALAGRRVSIGPPGSFANRSYRELMVAAGIDAPSTGVYELQDSAGVEALLNGEVDAVWIIDSFSSENIKRLVSSPDLNLYSWNFAEAFIERIPYLSKINLPAGYFDIGRSRPAKDVTLLSTAVTLLVESDLSPALQWGFLLAARDYQTHNYDDLSAGTVFPKYIDKSVPLSAVAEQYFNDGVPSIFHYFPLYFASLLERTWIWILAAFFVAYPLFERLSKFREFHSRWTMLRSFQRLRTYEEQLVEAESIEQINATIAEINMFEQEVLDHWVDEENIKDYYLLRAAFGRVRETIAGLKKKHEQAAEIAADAMAYRSHSEKTSI
jgi:uncharacterized protein